jgi:hypothetical protein
MKRLFGRAFDKRTDGHASCARPDYADAVKADLISRWPACGTLPQS